MIIKSWCISETLTMLGSGQQQDSGGESRIDKMRKFLSSPLTRKKPTLLPNKTFGTPLETLLQRNAVYHSVPYIVTRLCEYIQENGLNHEGLFRISGNARSVERLRASFDRSGDAPLETEGDVPSAAALLKLFLRELPDPIIPLNMHSQFLNAVKDKEKDESIPSLADLVNKLPLTNYSILSYLSCFLKKVSDKEDRNRMSASSLGIVFGPNLFRVTEDFVGLKEQSLTNQIVTYFITNYQDIFKKDPRYHESSEISTSNSCRKLPTMVASWPEVRGCTSTMLSSWSLGPLSIPMSSDDTYLPLCPVSYSTEISTTNSFPMCNQDEPDFSSISEISSKKDSNSDYSYESGTEHKHLNDDLNSISLSCNSESPQHQEPHTLKPKLLSEAEVDAALSLSLQGLLLENHSDYKSSFDQIFRKNSIEGGRIYSHDDAEISLRIPDLNSKVNIDLETGQLSLDSHKSYPRGRRRHDRHFKKFNYEHERRSRSELRSSTHNENEDECNGNSTFLTHSSKQDPLHNSTGALDESDFELRHSWPAFRKCHEDDIALSPLPQPLEVSQFSEAASVSPSAYRSYLSHRNLHLDPNLPPSPPVEQEDLVTGTNLEDSPSCAKQLTKKVHALKKKIKLFEENFEKLYGYKPTTAEKSNNFAVKKMLAELNKAKQDLKLLKQEPSLWSEDDMPLTKSTCGVNTNFSQGLFTTQAAGAGNLSIEDSVKEVMEYLARHRTDENRPEALEEMTKDQLIAEKVLVQKVLLNFEGMHGRPSTKNHRELVRPLYDRYRNTKRLIARMSASKDPAELQPILEHETMNFPASEQTNEPHVNPSVKNPEEDPKSSQNLRKGDKSLPHISFHELSLSELTEELNATREEKRKIRKVLREFEEQFKKENRRKVQREDKHCMESHYTEYKNVKAKLKLLEALVAKHEHTS